MCVWCAECNEGGLCYVFASCEWFEIFCIGNVDRRAARNRCGSCCGRGQYGFMWLSYCCFLLVISHELMGLA